MNYKTSLTMRLTEMAPASADVAAAESPGSETVVLMTSHGTIVCHDGEGALSHVQIDDLAHHPGQPLRFELRGFLRAGRHDRMLCNSSAPHSLSAPPGLLPGCAMIVGSDRRTAAIRNGAHFYSADPHRPDLQCDRSSAGGWESFLFLSTEDLAGIARLRRHGWIRATTGRIYRPGDIGFREGFVLAIGDLAIDLRYNTPFMPHGQAMARNVAGALAFDVLIDGWKIERLHLYRPVVFFTVFKSPFVLDQAFTAISSLLEFGGYDGNFHIITDHDRQVFLDAVPALDPGRLSTQKLQPEDWVGYVAAKYCILDHADAYRFQPLLFLDTDVVCDAPIEPMLTAIVMLERMSAALEEVTTLQNNPSVGATLIQKAGFSPRFACGLNGGTVGIPNLVAHAETLELTRTIITNHAELYGRDQFRWVDQEVLNYVSYRVGNFDTASLNRFVRFGWENAEFQGNRRMGLVHFWPGIEGRPKENRMRDYVATLRATGQPRTT